MNSHFTWLFLDYSLMEWNDTGIHIQVCGLGKIPSEIPFDFNRTDINAGIDILIDTNLFGISMEINDYLSWDDARI